MFLTKICMVLPVSTEEVDETEEREEMLFERMLSERGCWRSHRAVAQTGGTADKRMGDTDRKLRRTRLGLEGSC